MGGITEGLALESLALHFQLPHSKKMVSSWDKVRSYLDMMDIPDLRSSLPFSSTSSLSSNSSDSNQHSLSLGARSRLVGEKTTHQILSVIQPTIDSETRRKQIIEYLQRVIGDAFGIKVFPFGSVPLKTYLPHGDVDLTAISHYKTSQELAADMCTLLENEKNNANISVRDVLCVPAQVRVVKCTVGDIAVDISINQTAGLCALYFLEQVDQFIGKDHLFKLSVILIKAWCYYESRLLGGVHGLISTYALETMVLHVINLFHSSLHCPLAVLYKFLEYYSTFDWKNYCIGINGLVVISSLPKIEVVLMRNCDELLLTEEFLRSAREGLLPSAETAPKSSAFPVKFLNILDPLRDDNNLGRSVSRGNFFRIKSALSYGTQKLSDILTLPPEKFGVGLETFFKNTLDRNGKGRRVDVLVPVAPYGSVRSAAKTDNNDLLTGIQYGLWFEDYDVLYHARPATSAACYVWNNGWSEVGPNIQYDQNAFYNMEESPPSSVDSPGVFRVNYAAPVEEKWTSRGNFPFSDSPRGQPMNNLIFEKQWKLRGTSPMFDNTRAIRPNNAASAADERWKSRGTTSSVEGPRGAELNTAVAVEEKWKSRRATSSVDNPRTFQLNGAVSHEENWKSRGTSSSRDCYGGLQLNNAASVEEKQKPREICEYMPHLEHLVQENLTLEEDEVGQESANDQDEFPLLPGSRKDEESEKDSKILDSQVCTSKGSNIPSDVGESSCRVSFSMDEFPLLPGSKPIPIRASPSAYVKCEPFQEMSDSLDSTEFGSLRPTSPISVSLSEAGKRSDSDSSVFLDALSDFTVAAEFLEEDRASSKSEEKMAVPVQPLLLTDESEFPALVRPEKPVITLSKKEFPPLGACLKSQKKKWKKNSK